ncbi:MAG: hypothetical protein HDT38_03290 [Clostridiales bacterium]|nr:hypothetical protein [Clostridiales bacterium]
MSSAHTPPPPEVKLAVAGDVTQAPDDTAARQAHEAAEAKRKAEWDAQQAEKKATEQAELDKLAALSDDDASRLSAHRIAANVEKITRLNMKQQVADHLQALCLKDPAFARKTIQPRKSLARCFRYISRKAFAYVKDELEADGIRPGPGSEGYGCAVRDDLVYEWAENYYNDPNAEEDRKDDDEQFVPKPYIPTASAPRKKTQGKADKKPLKPKDEAYAGQITLGGFAPMEAKAG